MLVNDSKNNPGEIPFSRVRQYIYKIIRRRIPHAEDAEDVTQNVLIRGWRSNEKNSDRLTFETEDDFKRYFSVIAINEVRRFYSEQSKINLRNLEDEELIALAAEQLSPDYALEILETICQLPLKQRLALILGESKLLTSFQTVFSSRIIAELLEINQTLLEKLADEIPLSDSDIKYVIETLLDKKLKTTVRDERWKGRKFLDRILPRK